jgi:hypothetical protein
MNPYPSEHSIGDASRIIICYPSPNGEPEITALGNDTACDEIAWPLRKAVFNALFIDRNEPSRYVSGFAEKMKYVLVGQTVNDDGYYATTKTWKILDMLTVKYGFKWLFLGWDEEPRLVAHGASRAQHPKVIIDYEGRYVIKPRCRLCHERTGWCRCFETLEEAVQCLEGEKHYCDGCSAMLTLERWLRDDKPDWMLRDYWRYLMDNALLDQAAGVFQDIDLESVALSFSDYYDEWLVQETENWDEDDTFCECPLEG